MRRLSLSLFLCFAAAPLGAQEIPGIRVDIRYDPGRRPVLAVQPFSGPAPAEVLDSLTAIVRRDLEYSDRFNMFSVVPDVLRQGVDYAAWNDLRVWYLLTGSAQPAARGFDISLDLHDVVYSTLKRQRTFRLPALADPDFRMAVHAVADDVLAWLFDQTGAAATRIAFTRPNPPGQDGIITHDLLIVDSDGWGLRRLSGAEGSVYSPTWSPDGRRLAYTINPFAEGGMSLVEREIDSGRIRELVTITSGQLLTPEYSPDGSRLAYAYMTEQSSIYELGLADGSRRTIIGARREEIAMFPTYSPDGRQIAFMSGRLGNPHIFVANVDGTGQSAVTPTATSGVQYTAPSWSPTGERIAFTGRFAELGQEQILTSETRNLRGTVTQITNVGQNEDPSWAPDGRHIVYSWVGGGARGLYVIDAETGVRRLLSAGGATQFRMAEWSPRLVRAEELVVR